MKIGFLTDQCPCCLEGGAQLNNWGMIKKGISRGHDIKMITPQNLNLRTYSDCDIVILCNIMTFPKEYIKKICSEKDYIVRHHDFNFYKFRLFYHLEKGNDKGIDREFWSEIYKNAKMHIWLSPLHREAYLTAFPQLKKFKNVCIPSSIDTDMWKENKKIERKKGSVIAVNSLEKFKGRYAVNKYVEEHPELEFTFVGTGHKLNLPNCKYVGYVKNEKLPALYNEHEFFLHLNEYTEPFGRTSVEAMLCGCRIITNENNGAFSYDWIRAGNIPQIRHNIKHASVGFWEEIEIMTGELKMGKLKLGR